ncbi:MAG: hypothetical protein U5L04_02565 [Trueperaceae bacterium]|nr:hypothetical protein [Trueperaceae bacterium]
MAVNSHENYYSLSDHSQSHPESPERYQSAANAVDTYLEMRIALEGAPALDPERAALNVQTQPSPENPAIRNVSDLQILERAFDYALDRARARALRAARRNVDVDLDVLAELVGVTVSRLKRLEDRGEYLQERSRGAPPPLVRRMAVALETDVESLWRPVYWRVWVAIRVHGASLRSVEISKSSASRYRDEMDRWVEQWLAGNGLLTYGVRRDHEVRAELRNDDGEF